MWTPSIDWFLIYGKKHELPKQRLSDLRSLCAVVLEMRDTNQNAGIKKQRLELLAEHFLRVTRQGSESDSMSRFESSHPPRAGLTVTM
jgi:hypothetical protein